MPDCTYRMTSTAETHFWKALRDTKQKWGNEQAEKYRIQFLAGLQHLADNHHSFSSPHREELAQGTAFSIHLVERRYVAFQVHDKNTIIIAGIFHENMDIPNRLQELHGMTDSEIDAIKRVISHTSKN